MLGAGPRCGGAAQGLSLLKRTFCALAVVCAPGPAWAEPLPDAIRAMLQTAVDTGDPATVASVFGVAKRTVPDNAPEIDAMAADFYAQLSAQKEEQARAAEERIAAAGPLKLWKGNVELGGSWSSGNSRVLDVYGGLDLTRTGINWTHRVSGRVEYQETSGNASTERVRFAYQPQRRFGEQFYVSGIGQYEHDRFLGYRHRYTTGVGLGVRAVDRPDLQINFDTGPAARFTEYYLMPAENRIAARGAFHLKWLPSPRITFTQEAALYLQRSDTTAKSQTAVETRLFGPLKARLSYEVQYEGDAPAGQDSIDTISRMSLVYSF